MPKGTTIAVSQWVSHRDGRFFAQPEIFRPDRWLTGQRQPPFAFFPFGGGPRVCVGARLAMTELTLIAAETARQVVIEPVPGCEARPNVALALQPTGLRIRARRRRARAK